MKKDATSATSALQDDGCGRQVLAVPLLMHPGCTRIHNDNCVPLVWCSCIQRRSFRKRDWNTSKCHSSNAAAAGPADDMRAETARGRENAKDRIVEEQLQRIQDLLEQKDRRILELEHELQVEKQNRIAQEQQAQKWRDQAEQCQCRHTLNSVGKVSTSQVQSDADNLDELRAAAKQAEEVQRAEQLTRLAQEAAKERAAAKRAIVERQKVLCCLSQVNVSFSRKLLCQLISWFTCFNLAGGAAAAAAATSTECPSGYPAQGSTLQLQHEMIAFLC